ncbi:MAG: hypothetical protein RJA22_3007 [Verrucomicrobiota bacterium]|jgi:NADH-quinone oxidoreductase subunit J
MPPSPHAPLSWPFLVTAVLTVVAAGGAMGLRNLVHCALCLVVTFAGLATLFLQLNAQFLGFAQILVYVGAVAILIVFAILLTRGADAGPSDGWTRSTLGGLAIAALVWFCLRAALLASPTLAAATRTAARPETPTLAPAPVVPAAPVREIGARLMQDYVLPLEVIGLLLTAALLGAVIIALQERREP